MVDASRSMSNPLFASCNNMFLALKSGSSLHESGVGSAVVTAVPGIVGLGEFTTVPSVATGDAEGEDPLDPLVIVGEMVSLDWSRSPPTMLSEIVVGRDVSANEDVTGESVGVLTNKVGA